MERVKSALSLNCIKSKIQGGPTIPAIYTKPPSKSYKLSETHDFYVKDLRQLPENLPLPRPPNKSKTETIDIVEYMLVDDKAIRVPMTTLSKPIEALVEYLIEGYDDDLSKVRVLFRWLTNQPINRMQVLEHEPKNKNSALHHLWMLRTKKQRYSNTFSVMCRYAGLYCVIIHGAVKGVNYQIGEKIDMSKHYGEWNAVRVEGDWRFVDTLWGACDLRDPGDGRGRFKCDERFFLTDPKDMIFTHFAETPRWQLLDSPRHIDSFEETANLKNRFFELGMQVLSHPLCEIEAQDGEVEVVFGIQPKQVSEQKFNCYISHFDRPETRRYLTNGSNNSVPIFIHKLTDSSISIKVRFPEQGIFRMEIVGKQTNKGSVYKEYDWVAVYKVLVEESANTGFPKMDAVGWGPGKDISKIGLAPFNYTSGVIVAKNTQTKLRFKIVDTNLVQNMKFFFKMASTYDNDFNINSLSDKFEVDLNIMTFFIEAPPFGEYTLKMYARNVRGNVPLSERREINICNYLLISDVPQRNSPLGILTEKTEIADDPPERPTQSMKSEPLIEKQPEVAESIVSASNVVMDTNSHAPESIRNSPDGIDDTKSPEPIPRESSAKSQTKQTFVRVDQDLQEIPEIPLNVVMPVQPDKQTTSKSPDKREMKVVSTNKVVPLKTAGGDDDSIMLVPAEEKAKRPATGVRRTRTRDDTKLYTALAKVRGEK
ncbi:hillarin-like [Mercenaria mercenaria]|uniref:hillarin-like n=1 Tax=Mercenaria mercenaria TaxID=6596 RepID=UPI00234F32F6|nr:hillarin-like [Mercenaria mercenaria]